MCADMSVPVFFREKCRTQLLYTIQEEKISELEEAGLSGQNICPHNGMLVSSSDCFIGSLAPSYSSKSGDLLVFAAACFNNGVHYLHNTKKAILPISAFSSVRRV